MTTDVITGWEMAEPGGPMARTVRPMRRLEDEEVLVRVAGCGVCHTDLGFLYDGVRTRHAAPLILGHEISGWVEDSGNHHRDLVGRAVVVPAVIPCGECVACRIGRPTICRRQVMPGNDRDGGFATYVILPGRGLCPVPGATEDAHSPLGSVPGLTLRHLAVVADAVSTAYQSVERSGLASGEIAIVVGLGGVGTYAAQFASRRGAVVVGVDVDPRPLQSATAIGVGLALDGRELPPKEARSRILEFARSRGASEIGWKIFECSGTPGGQKAAFSLLVPGATLLVVGFTRQTVEISLSHLMAFDARAIGNWGCAPDLFPRILEQVLDGSVDVVSHTELRPLAHLREALEDVHSRRAVRRIVLTPDGDKEVA
ncbi:MAG TPA: 6-hydroxycyclohex-1-ene-1-carbonyl-CoA dehydrogenase [Thermoanaerobaculia bacterium]|nr:6-hydroxycyclohex-1-ene-1-carbonyl-CoA dehydrogenase [Thermoanaerobaculia bacterium]